MSVPVSSETPLLLCVKSKAATSGYYYVVDTISLWRVNTYSRSAGRLHPVDVIFRQQPLRPLYFRLKNPKNFRRTRSRLLLFESPDWHYCLPAGAWVGGYQRLVVEGRNVRCD